MQQQQQQQQQKKEKGKTQMRSQYGINSPWGSGEECAVPQENLTLTFNILS